MQVTDTLVCFPRTIQANYDANGAPCDDTDRACPVVYKREVLLDSPAEFIMVSGVLSLAGVEHDRKVEP